jgi:2-oxoglutarate dehydrogenase E1 component
MGAYSFMLMNFNLKMEISFIKSLFAPASGSYTRAKRRHADAIKWYLIKIYLDKKLV